MVAVDGPVAVAGRKPRALLAYLLLHANETIPRERLVDALWGEEPPSSAANALQVHVHALRKAVGADRVLTHGTGYRLRVEQGELDLERFERLVRDRRFAEALVLWHGTPLAGLEEESFAAAEIARLEEARLAALECHIESELEQGRHEHVVGELEPLIREHPLRERLRVLKMLALYRAGRQADALASYADARRALDELGIEPGRELRELERSILRQDPAIDSAGPEPLHVRLPMPATPLVGRELELVAATALLQHEEIRLLTLLGPGGTGKTRLALELGRTLASDFADGVAFVDLAPIEDETLVPSAVGAALGVTEAPGSSPVESVAAALRNRELLLVLDNFEHVVEAAPEVTALLAAAPQVKALVTSRSPLRVSGEHAYDVPPLDVPRGGAEHDPAALARNDAVRLFVARASAVAPGFELRAENAAAIAEICRAVDGLPLALELAAARSRLLPPDVLSERLAERLDLLGTGARDAPSRHRTLRATIDWSYRLLAERERRVFARLAVFAGGCTLAAAERVCEAELDVIETLLDSSLVRRDGERLQLLETVRRFAQEQLVEAGDEQTVRRAHAEFFVAVTEPLELSAGEHDVLRELDPEQDNLRAALAFCAEEGLRELQLRLCARLWRYWYVRGFLSEGRAQLESALALPEPTGVLRAAALRAHAVITWAQGDLERAERSVAESLRLFRLAGDDSGTVGALITSGLVAHDRGDLERAKADHEESRRLAHALGQPEREGAALANLGDVAQLEGDEPAARELYEESLAVCRAAGDLRGSALALMSLGIVALRMQSDLDAAQRRFQESLEVFVELGFRERIVSCLTGLAAATAGNDPERAATMLGAGEGLRESSGLRVEAWWERPVLDETAASLDRALGDGFAVAFARGRSAPDAVVASLTRGG